MKAFSMGIKYSKLIELVKEEQARQLVSGSPSKVLPPRPNLNERKDSERNIIQEQKIAFLSSAELLNSMKNKAGQSKSPKIKN